MEIQPLLFTCLPNDIIKLIYKNLCEQKQIPAKLKDSIVNYHLLGDILESEDLFWYWFDCNLVVTLIKEIVDFKKINRSKYYNSDYKKVLLKMWQTLSSDEKLEFYNKWNGYIN